MNNKRRMWFGITAVFLCGLVIGGFGGHLFARYQASSHLHEIKKDDGSFMAEIVLKRLRGELELTDKQADELKPLLVKVYQEGHKQVEKTRALMDALLKDAMTKVARHLTKSQLEIVEQKGGFRILLPFRRPGPPPGPPPRP